MLLSTPKAFDYFPAAEKVKSISKITHQEGRFQQKDQQRLKVSTESHDVGGSGGMQNNQKLSKVTRDESSISITWQSAALETIEKFDAYFT